MNITIKDVAVFAILVLVTAALDHVLFHFTGWASDPAALAVIPAAFATINAVRDRG